MPIPYSWGTDPSVCSGAAEQELAYYEDWLTEYAIWSAMAGQDEDGPA